MKNEVLYVLWKMGRSKRSTFRTDMIQGGKSTLKTIVAGHLELMLVILTTQGAAIRRITV
jgi:hypothetical protein